MADFHVEKSLDLADFDVEREFDAPLTSFDMGDLPAASIGAWTSGTSGVVDTSEGDDVASGGLDATSSGVTESTLIEENNLE